MHVIQSIFIAHSQVNHPNADREPPAKAARELFETTRPDLGDRPFGQIVSLIARGIDLPAATTAGTPAEDPSDASSEPADADNSGEVSAANKSANATGTSTDITV